MSSRVQKGNAVFKPVGKARPRAATNGSVTRQPSIAPNPAQDYAAAGPQMRPPPPPPPMIGSISESTSEITPPNISPVLATTTSFPSSHTPLVPNTASLQGNLPSPPLFLPSQNSSRSNGTPIPSPIPTLSRTRSVISPPVNSPNPRTPVPRPEPSSSALTQPVIATAPRNALSVPSNGLAVPSNGPVGNSLPIPSNHPSYANSLSATSSASAPSSSSRQSDQVTEKVKTGKGKRQRSITATPEGDDEPSSKKGGRGRRSKAPSLPPYDPNADPGEDIDPTVVTMASLCDDTGQGRVSSKAAEIQNNHALWKQRNREKRNRMKAHMEAKKYGHTDEEADLIADQGDNSMPLESPIVKSSSSGTPLDENDPNFDYSQDLATSKFNVQVKIGPNGETIIDEDSLVVNREEADETANYTHITESDHTKFVNSGTYGKRYRGSRWSAEETELFFEALSQFGENYELIAYVLPGRDRKSCKNKFKVEDKRNHARINYCLDNKTEVDIATLSRMTGKDFSGPVPEISAPTPRPSIVPDETPAGAPADVVKPTKRKRAKSSPTDGGLVIVGDAASFQPNFEAE